MAFQQQHLERVKRVASTLLWQMTVETLEKGYCDVLIFSTDQRIPFRACSAPKAESSQIEPRKVEHSLDVIIYHVEIVEIFNYLSNFNQT